MQDYLDMLDSVAAESSDAPTTPCPDLTASHKGMSTPPTDVDGLRQLGEVESSQMVLSGSYSSNDTVKVNVSFCGDVGRAK